MLNFNAVGLLEPDNNIQSSILELERFFVTDIQTAKRKELFENYISYSNSLSGVCDNADLKQWVDGSFVSKKPEPNDIDLVTFIDFSVVEALNNQLVNYKYPASQNIFGVDAYLVSIYPPEHKCYPLYLADWAYWMSHFNRTRRNRIGNKLRKGFLEINL
jgi:hypothetical protein